MNMNYCTAKWTITSTLARWVPLHRDGTRSVLERRLHKAITANDKWQKKYDVEAKASEGTAEILGVGGSPSTISAAHGLHGGFFQSIFAEQYNITPPPPPPTNTPPRMRTLRA